MQTLRRHRNDAQSIGSTVSKRLLILGLVSIGLLAGCVTVPTGPAVLVMPGPQKSFEQFRMDEDACRQYAQGAIGGPYAGQAASDAAAANAVAGAALGAAAGAILGSVSGQAGQGAAIGAGTGLLFGSAAGSNVGASSSYAMQRNYDIAYMQCMYARGNQIPGQAAARGSAPRYAPGNPPPNYPPPSYPPPNYPPPQGVPAPRG
jgi:Glycine-zipper domain